MIDNSLILILIYHTDFFYYVLVCVDIYLMQFYMPYFVEKAYLIINPFLLFAVCAEGI